VGNAKPPYKSFESRQAFWFRNLLLTITTAATLNRLRQGLLSKTLDFVESTQSNTRVLWSKHTCARKATHVCCEANTHVHAKQHTCAVEETTAAMIH